MPWQKKENPVGSPYIIKKSETDQMKAAFEYYFNCGPNRSYKRTSEFFHVTVNTVAIWARSFKWQERLASRNELVGQKLEERGIAIQTELQAEQLAILEEWKKRLVTIGHKYLDTAAAWYESDRARLRPEDFVNIGRLFKELLEDNKKDNGNTTTIINVIPRQTAPSSERSIETDARNEIVEGELIQPTNNESSNEGSNVQPPSTSN